ncbi:MAG: YidC/Oxa1 family membrane protein insertase [Acutalibacter sp.]|nr:YidC/Oxa1 family membrane protein insertase [Acutalibacter sp.]
MMAIFNFFGSILGYLLWFLYSIFRNYGVAILLFTIILKIVLFPMSVKQQRSMASQSKLADKQKELQKLYANNQQKYNDELMKLYEKEGVNPGAGCLTTLLPFPIMLGIFYSVIMPLSNTLHIASETVQQATDYISRIPGVASATGLGMYSELQIIKHFEVLRPNLTMFSPEDLEKIDFFSTGFRFLGLDLLSSPQGSGFLTFLWVIPVLSLVLSFGSQWYMTRSTGQTQTGCTKAMMYVFPLISVYWAFIMPAAVGMYNIISIVTSALQTLVMNKYFSTDQLTAGNEARRAVALELAEAGVRPLPAAQQKLIADKLASAPQQKQAKDAPKQKQQKKKKQGSSSGDSASYMGSKK